MSGNGFGQADVEDGAQRTADDEDFGHFDERHAAAGDNRANFLMNYKEHILMLWHLADSYDVLNTVVCVLSSNVAVDGDASDSETQIQPSVGLKKRKAAEEKRHAEAKKFRDEVSAALTTMSRAKLLEEYRNAQSSSTEFEVKSMDYELAERQRRVYDQAALRNRVHAQKVKAVLDEMEPSA